jgi:MoxR-like ATPase
MPFSMVESLQEGLAREHYLADRGLSTAIFLAVSLDKPLLLEGEAGVGKTEVAKVLASLLGRELIRLQCYEGIDASQALYEWNYSKQLIAVRAMQDVTAEANVEDLFGPEYLVERPLLAAIRAGSKAVLLVDCSIARTTSSRRSCSRSCPSSPSRSPRSAAWPRRSRPWSS